MAPHTYRVIAARFLSRTGSEAAFFVGIWGAVAYVMRGTAADLAVVMFALGVSVILGSAASGLLVDRYGPKTVLAIAEVLYIPAALALTLADDLVTMTALVVVWGFAGAPVTTAGASFAPFLVTESRQLERINAWIEGAASAAFVAGPALGAAIALMADVRWVFVLDAATSLAAAAFVWTVPLRPPQRQGQAADRHPLRELKEGLIVTYSSHALRYYVLMGTVVWLSFGAFGALEPLFFRDVVGTDVSMLGWVNSLGGLGFIAGAALLPRLPRRFISARGFALLVALNGLALSLYVATPDLRVIAAAIVIWGVVVGVMEPLVRTLIHRDAPEHAVGRVIGIAEVHRNAGELVPLAFVASLAAALGVQATMIAGGISAGLLALASVGRASRIDRELAAAPAREVKLEGLRARDEPISPNR